MSTPALPRPVPASDAPVDPDAWLGYRLLEIRNGGSRLSHPRYSVALPPGGTAETLVQSPLAAIGFDEDHCWVLSQPVAARGHRRVGTRRYSGENWTEYFGPAASVDDWIEFGGFRPRWHVAADYSVDALFGHLDEAHLMFDFGEKWQFRLRLLHLHRNSIETRAARALLADPVARAAAAPSPMTLLTDDGGVYTPEQVTRPVLLSQPPTVFVQYYDWTQEEPDDDGDGGDD